MHIAQVQTAIARLNSDFTTLPRAALEAIETTCGLASGQISCRRYTLPGDAQRVRDEVRQHFLDEAAWCQSYLEPETGFPPEALGLTDAILREAKLVWLMLATQVRRS